MEHDDEVWGYLRLSRCFTEVGKKASRGFFLAVFGSEQPRVGHCLPSRSLHLASSQGEALRFKSGPLVGRVHHTQIYAGVVFLGTPNPKTDGEICMHALIKCFSQNISS